MLWVAVCLASLAVGAQAAPKKAVFSSYTEDPTDGWAHASEALAVRLLAGGRAKAELDRCISERGLAKNYRQFLVTKSVTLSNEKARFIFVRPVSHPYCGALYGAHIYSFWIVDHSKKVIFATSADALDVLPTKHNGLHDLLVSQCRGGYCYRTRYTFNAHAYREESCATEAIESGESVPGCATAVGMVHRFDKLFIVGKLRNAKTN